MPALKAGKTIGRQGAHPIGQVNGHAAVEDTHLGQIPLELLLVAQHAVQGRTLLDALQGHEIIDQADIGQIVAAQPQKPAGQTVEPERSQPGEAVAAEPQIRLFLPAPPEHAQMGVVEFVRQVSQHLFRVEIAEAEAMGRRRAGGDKERQEMLDDLDHQVTEVFFKTARHPVPGNSD